MKKIISIFLIIMFITTYFVPVLAINKALLYMTHYTDYYLQFSNGNKVRTAVVVYNNGGTEYPAYCIEPSKDGVGELPSYEVDFRDKINDNGLWRIVTNGYPYKTPQQMGLANEDEAYMATKQAIYRYLANEDETYYGGGGIGSAGARVYNAIAKLLDIGYNGTETIINATANIIQEKELNFDSINTNYYSATYTVTSNTSYQHYSVSINSDKTGILITDENNNVKSKFNYGEKFKILIPRNIVLESFQVAINATLSCRTKPILYAEAYNPDYQDYIITGNSYEDVKTYNTLTVEKLKEDGKLIIYKLDKDTKTPIEGVTFELYNESNELVGKATTDSKGVATFTDLYEGTYTLKEVSTNKYYILNEKPIIVDIPFNDKKEIVVENEVKKGRIKIIKLDQDNNDIKLQGVEFKVYDEDNNLVDTLITDQNGEATSKELRIDKTYTVKESKTLSTYVLNEEFKVITLNENQIIDVIFTNELKKGQIRVIKVDADNKEVRLQGVKFNVLDENGDIVDALITDENGEAISKKLRIDKEYILQETKTLENYVLNGEMQTVRLEQDKIKDVIFTNELKKGQIRVIKVDADNKEVRLQGVKFNVLDENGDIVDTLITNENGEAISKKLRIDKEYILQETETLENYVLNEAMQTVRLEQDKIKDVIFTNELKKGQIRVIKVDADNKEVRLQGVRFNVLDKNGEIVDTLITNENGEAISKKLRIDKEYILQETKTLEDYVINEEIKTVILKENQITDILFENEKIKGFIQVTKTSSEFNKYSNLEKGSPIPNVVFEIYDLEGNLVDTIISDENGIAISKELVKNKYKVKEVVSGKYYLLNENTFEVEIINNKEIVNIDVTNENVEIDVEIQKNGFIETQSKDNIFYNFKNIKNNSNVSLDTFIWSDHLPIDAVRIDKLYTGTWNEDLEYDVYYKTNKSEDYILFKENLNTQTIYELNFKELQLQEDEYITDYEFRFEKVKAGFQEVDSPILYCDILDGLGNGYVFTNKTKVKGTYYEKEVEANDDWTTITYFKEIRVDEVLPKTRRLVS